MPILPKNETNCSKSKFAKILEPDSRHISGNSSFDKKAEFPLMRAKKLVKSGYSSLIYSQRFSDAFFNPIAKDLLRNKRSVGD